MVRVFLALVLNGVPYGLDTVMHKPSTGELIRMWDYSTFKITTIIHNIGSEIIKINIECHSGTNAITEETLKTLKFTRQDV